MKCNHKFKQLIEVDEDLGGTKREWLTFVCSKCGIKTESLIIRDEKFNKEWSELREDFDRIEELNSEGKNE